MSSGSRCFISFVLRAMVRQVVRVDVDELGSSSLITASAGDRSSGEGVSATL